MQPAAARVEKAVSKVPGVTSCSVSLLTNSMGVEGTASPTQIIRAVQDAGYGASLKGASEKQQHCSVLLRQEEALEDHETPVLKTTAYRIHRLSAGADVFLHGTYDVGTGRCLHGSIRTTMLLWDWYSCCLQSLSWSSTRNSLSADLRACGIVRQTWIHW